MKKFLSLALAVLMVCALFAGCAKTPASSAAPTPSQTDSKPETSSEEVQKLDPYEVKWILRISPQDEAATTHVMKNINENVLPKLIDNTTLNIEWISAAEYVEKLKLKFSGKEEFDLCYMRQGYGYSDFAQQKALVNLNDYWDYLPETRKIIPESWWEALSIDGECLAIPNYTITARNFAVGLQNEVIEKMNLDVSTVKTLDDVEKVLEWMMNDEKYKKTTAVSFLSQFDIYPYCGLENLAENLIGISIDKPTKVINLFENEEWINVYKRCRKWNEKGWYKTDVWSMSDDITLCKSGYVSLRFDCWQPGVESMNQEKYGMDMTYKMLSDPTVTTGTVRSNLTSVSFTSRKPERACMVVDLINSNADLFNALCYGIEGVNYTLNADQSATPLKDNGYAVSSWNWQMGNVLIGYRLQGQPEDFAEATDKLNRDGKVSPVLGFSFVSADVMTEMSACKAILKNYQDGLRDGNYEDVEGTLKKLNDELYAAGLQKVIDECQKQLDAWYAAKK